jgi:hypothetical protein
VGCADLKSLLKQPIPPHSDQCVCFEGYWVPLGNVEPIVDAKVKYRCTHVIAAVQHIVHIFIELLHMRCKVASWHHYRDHLTTVGYKPLPIFIV